MIARDDYLKRIKAKMGNGSVKIITGLRFAGTFPLIVGRKYEIIPNIMCEMLVSKKVCRRTPVRITRDRTLDGLAEYVRTQCATLERRKKYLASVGFSRSASGRMIVTPL